jgi:hypothetical protein
MLLERTAHELNCPDFGMRLAMTQGGLKVLGPLEFAMRNSSTIREAFQYCASHPQVYSTDFRSDQGRRASRGRASIPETIVPTADPRREVAGLFRNLRVVAQLLSLVLGLAETTAQ